MENRMKLKHVWKAERGNVKKTTAFSNLVIPKIKPTETLIVWAIHHKVLFVRYKYISLSLKLKSEFVVNSEKSYHAEMEKVTFKSELKWIFKCT